MGLGFILKQAGIIKGRYERHTIAFTVNRSFDDVHTNIMNIVKHHGKNWTIEDNGETVIETLNPSTSGFGAELCEGQTTYVLTKVNELTTKVSISVVDPVNKNADTQCESLKKAIEKGKNHNL